MICSYVLLANVTIKKRKFTGEIQPDAIHRTATVFLNAVNAALKEG